MLFLSLLLLAAPSSRERIAVLGLEAKDAPPALVSAIEETIAAEASLASGLDVTSPQSMRSYVGLQEKQQLLGCTGDRCLDEASRLLAADLMLSGTLVPAADGWLLGLTLADLRKQKTLKRVSREIRGDATELAKKTRALTAALFGVVGKIAIWNQPAEAEVYLDGRFVGPTPVAPISVDAPGAHALEISGPGVTPWRSDIVVEDGATQRVRALNVTFADLQAQAIQRRWIAGGTLALGASAAIASSILFGLAVDNDRRLDRLDLRATDQRTLDDVTSRTLGLTVGGSLLCAATAGLVAGAIYLFVTNPSERALKDYGVW